MKIKVRITIDAIVDVDKSSSVRNKEDAKLWLNSVGKEGIMDVLEDASIEGVLVQTIRQAQGKSTPGNR